MALVRGTCYTIGALMHGGFRGRNMPLEEAVATGLDFVGADAGSTDAGPAFLGGERGMTHRWGIKQCLDELLSLCVPRGVPVLIGSAGMGGTRAGLNEFREILEEVAREKKLHFRAAYLDSELDKSYLKAKLREGCIRPLEPLPPLTEEAIDRSVHTVALMGTEPYIKALSEGATVILGGRTTDPALFAAVPIWKGVPLSVAWHMAKVIDHVTVNIEPQAGVETWAMGIADDSGFKVQATNPRGKCTAVRVAQATMHENRSPALFYEPPGSINISACKYEQIDARTVQVTGTKFTPFKYTLKLEGAERVGYRSITVCGLRDPEIIRTLDARLDALKTTITAQAHAQGIRGERFNLLFHVYGKNGCLGQWEPQKQFVPLEVGIVGECIADSQDIASAVINMTHFYLHSPLSAAFPFSPHNLDFGAVYQFHICHLLELEEPMDCSQIQIVDL
jgi:hypothetical protein